jgi:hypothetical protein
VNRLNVDVVTFNDNERRRVSHGGRDKRYTQRVEIGWSERPEGDRRERVQPTWGYTQLLAQSHPGANACVLPRRSAVGPVNQRALPPRHPVWSMPFEFEHVGLAFNLSPQPHHWIPPPHRMQQLAIGLGIFADRSNVNLATAPDALHGMRVAAHVDVPDNRIVNPDFPRASSRLLCVAS